MLPATLGKPVALSQHIIFMVGIRYGCFLFTLLAACDAQNAIDIDDVLSNVSQGNAIYGFIYTAPPPQGTTLQIMVSEPRVTESCELFGSNASEVAADDFWYVVIEIGTTNSGDYEIVVSPKSLDEASARLVHIKSFNTQIKYRANRGRVILRNSVDDARGNLQLSVEADFPTLQPVEFYCEDEGTADGTLENTCTCKYENGREETCSSTGEYDNCCINDGSPYERFEADITAAFCPRMCGFTYPELVRYCY